MTHENERTFIKRKDDLPFGCVMYSWELVIDGRLIALGAAPDWSTAVKRIRENRERYAARSACPKEV